jgi:hypothetical protein
MEVDAKIKALEDEFKVLKAEIRNVLLDIREVILERTNPLAEEQQSAFIRMDLNTTARALASEAAGHEASKAADSAQAESHPPQSVAVTDEPAATDSEDASAAVEEGDLGEIAEDHPKGVKVVHVEETEEAPVAEPEVQEAPVAVAESDDVDDAAPAPKVIRRDPVSVGLQEPQDTEPGALPDYIPPMYRSDPLSLSGNVSVSVWLSDALAVVGPQELARIIAIQRLWGNLPPNISRALAYLQELLSATQESEPAWLKVMRDLDKLASL